ncbi:hypothetical protein [Streptomyces spiralis]|uniref:helix-turn-helix transcriptional regulator n=1 Tax=Streptomyces spiralis TaxID=66376 RepID=UPI00368A8141
MISDDQAAIIQFSLAPGGHSAGYLIHPSPMLVSLELFEAEWERALPLRDTVPPRAADTAAETVPADPGPAAQADTERRALLTMLTSGLTGAAIARTQGWSPSTTQRRIHGLMTELGASTRFQAAVMAARRGWL